MRTPRRHQGRLPDLPPAMVSGETIAQSKAVQAALGNGIAAAASGPLFTDQFNAGARKELGTMKLKYDFKSNFTGNPNAPARRRPSSCSTWTRWTWKRLWRSI